METRKVQEELMDVVQSLSPERQEELLRWAKSLARPERKPAPSTSGALVERGGFLVVCSKLDGPFVDHRQVRDE